MKDFRKSNYKLHVNDVKEYVHTVLKCYSAIKPKFYWLACLLKPIHVVGSALTARDNRKNHLFQFTKASPPGELPAISYSSQAISRIQTWNMLSLVIHYKIGAASLVAY